MTITTIPLFPLDTVLFPDGYLPLRIFEVRYLDMIGKAVAAGTGFGVIALTAGSEVRAPDRRESFVEVGTLATIRSHAAPMPGLMQIESIGADRFRVITSECLRNGLWMAQVEMLAPDQVVAIPDELQDTATALGNLVRTLQDEQVPTSEMPLQQPFRLDECGWVANRWAELLPLPSEQKLRLLALDNPLLRLELIQDVLQEQGVI